MKTKFTNPHSANTDPISSFETGEQITKSGERLIQCKKVLQGLLIYIEVTSAELAAYYRLDRTKVARRLPDLREQGLAQHCAKERCKNKCFSKVGNQSIACRFVQYQKCSVTDKKCLVWWPRYVSAKPLLSRTDLDSILPNVCPRCGGCGQEYVEDPSIACHVCGGNGEIKPI